MFTERPTSLLSQETRLCTPTDITVVLYTTLYRVLTVTITMHQRGAAGHGCEAHTGASCCP